MGPITVPVTGQSRVAGPVLQQHHQDGGAGKAGEAD